MTKSQNTKNEQQKDLCITVEKQVWESTLNRSMVLEAENAQLKELLKECTYRIDWRTKTGHKPTDDRKQKLFDEISEVLQ